MYYPFSSFKFISNVFKTRVYNIDPHSLIDQSKKESLTFANIYTMARHFVELLELSIYSYDDDINVIIQPSIE